MLRADRQDVTAIAIECICSVTALVGKAEFIAGDQVDGDMLFEDCDVRVFADFLG